MIFYSKTTDVHNDHLKYLIKKCQNHGIGLSKRKALLCQTSIEFLGLELDQGQVKLQPHVVSKILNDIHRFLSLQRFLGCLNYVNPFIKNLADLIKPLQQKLKKGVTWTWTNNDQEHVQHIQKICQQLPRLTLPRTG